MNNELVDLFRPHENEAKKQKARVHGAGTLAVLLMIPALLYTVLAGGLRSAPGWVEVASVVGTVLAVLASRWGHWRRSWLENRYLTEVIRQWHFARLLDGSAIDESISSEGQARYLESRSTMLATLVADHDGSVGDRMERLRVDATHPLGPVPEPTLPVEGEVRKELLDAYRVLRIDHQLHYAIHKTSERDRTMLGLPGSVLRQGAQAIAAGTLAIAMVASVLTIIGWEENLAPAVLVAVLCGVAVRAWRDGLSLDDEQERYEEIRQRLTELRVRWDQDGGDESRFRLARDVEDVMRSELRAFLRSHYRAQFLF